jgi:hypothetical protein
VRNAEICWSDSISEFHRSGLEGVENLHIKNVKSRSGEMILAIGSRCDLGRQIQEVNMADHVRKDSRGPLDQEDAW